MEKRLFLAIALSLLVLLTWSAMQPKPQHIENTNVTTTDALQKNAAAASLVPKETNFLPETPEQSLVKFDMLNSELVFDEQHAAINKIIFKEKLEYIFWLYSAFLTDNGNLQFKKSSSSSVEISFIHQDAEKQITKRFVIANNSNAIELHINVRNTSSSPLDFELPLVLARIDLSNKNVQSRYQDIYAVTKEKSLHLSPAKEYLGETAKVVGFRDRYFCLLVEPDEGIFTFSIKKLASKVSEVKLLSEKTRLRPGEQITYSFRIYLGPQDLDTISQINPSWSGIIYFGTFDFIGQLLLQLLGFFYGLVHNWGWAIIMLSLSVYLLLFPLTVKQMRSMKEMQHIQPKVEELRRIYKDNPQKLNKEIMELYKEHKVNPLGGCLPLILQMPIFFALYQALMRSVALRGSGFLWIKDLSQPDQLNLFSARVNILPILMAIGMFVQQKMSNVKTTKEAADQQKMMLIIMPVMFGVIFYNMPAGLVLYWFVNSTAMLLYQFRMYKQI